MIHHLVLYAQKFEYWKMILYNQLMKYLPHNSFHNEKWWIQMNLNSICTFRLWFIVSNVLKLIIFYVIPSRIKIESWSLNSPKRSNISRYVYFFSWVTVKFYSSRPERATTGFCFQKQSLFSYSKNCKIIIQS